MPLCPCIILSDTIRLKTVCAMEDIVASGSDDGSIVESAAGDADEILTPAVSRRGEDRRSLTDEALQSLEADTLVADAVLADSTMSGRGHGTIPREIAEWSCKKLS